MGHKGQPAAVIVTGSQRRAGAGAGPVGRPTAPSRDAGAPGRSAPDVDHGGALPLQAPFGKAMMRLFMRLPHAARWAMVVATLALIHLMPPTTAEAGPPAGGDRPVSPVVAPGPDTPAGAGAADPTGPALTVLSLETAPLDVYLDGARISPADGLGGGAFADAGPRPPGAATVEIFAHADADAVDGSPPAARADRIAEVAVALPESRSASLVIGPPAGEGPAPEVRVFDDDTAPPPPGSGRLVLRHTAATGPMDVDVVALGGDEVTFLTQSPVEPGGQLTVDVPVGAPDGTAVQVRAQTADALFALPELFSETLTVGSGQVHTAYVSPRRWPRHSPASCGPTGTIPPAGAENVSTADADLDGDGHRERAVLWSQVDGSVRTWGVGATGLGAGGVVARVDAPSTFDPASPWTAPALLGAADADGDGADELFLAVDHGGYTENVQVWGLRSCALAAVTLAGTTGGASFPVGASARDKAGVTCAYTGPGASLTTWKATADDDADAFSITTTDHHWADPQTLEPGAVMTWTRPATDEWTLLQSSGLRCGRPPYTLLPRVRAAAGASSAPAVAIPLTPSFTG
jgi:hypothetical protein